MMTAPTADRPAGFRRGFGWLVGAVWLFYLGQPLTTTLHHPPGVAKTVSLVALVAFAVAYVFVFAVTRNSRLTASPVPPTRAWLWLAILFGLGLLTMPAAGGDWLVTLVYTGAAAMMMLPPRAGIAFVVGLCALAVVGPVVVPQWHQEQGLVFAIGLAAFAVFGVTRLAEHNVQLRNAQAEIARLAVAEERARASRDLHDILGHSLTVIAVKAELAGRLMELDPARAGTEIADVERLAREALADIRRTVGAYREVTLESELASARSALAAAGVAAELPASVDGVPPGRNELFGWAVREGVTNVVRHSGARHCTVRVGVDFVEISDDGRGPNGETVKGHGLTGLRERAEQAGGQLAVGRTPEKGFRLRVSLDG